jgi:hypothetical protein
VEQAHKVKWIDGHREPQCAPNPNYPDGIDIIETNGDNTCKVALPYPAMRCGRYDVKCRACGRRVSVTTAGRPDDPRSVRMQCAGQKQLSN